MATVKGVTNAREVGHRPFDVIHGRRWLLVNFDYHGRQELDPKVMALHMNRSRIMLLLLQSVVIAACGGGSSGGSSNEPTPPPQASPPSVVIEATEETVLSGATFYSSVSGTADGLSTPTISMSCTDSVELLIDDSQVEFTVPEVSVLTQAVCTATVTDSSGRSASDTLSITILPETDIGQVVGIFDPPLELVLPNFNHPSEVESFGSHVVAITESSDISVPYQIKAIEGTSVVPRQYHRDDIVLVEGEYLSIDFVQSPSLDTHGLPGASMSIASALENKIYWHVMEPQSRDFTIQEVIDVNRPCFIAQTSTFWANDMVVGQVDLGLTIFDIETGSNVMNAESFDATLIHNIGAGRSLCHILRGIIPASIIEQHPGYTDSSPFDPNYASPLTAIDYNTNELVYFGDVNGDNAHDEMGAMPIEMNATGQLDIVQVISRGSPSQVPQYLIVLLSDGNHIGEHRVVQINFDFQTSEFTQQILHEWSEGVPVSVLQGQVGGSLEGGLFRSDLVVVLGTTEKSFFFDNLLPLDEGFSIPPEYGAPGLFDVGVGAGSAVAVESPYAPNLEQSDYGVLVSYPESGNVIYISLPVAQ